MGRLINKETRALSRPNGIPHKQNKGSRGRRIPSGGEGVRFAYTATQLPGHIGEVALSSQAEAELTSIEIEHIEAAKSFLEEGNLGLVRIFIDAGYVTREQLDLEEGRLEDQILRVDDDSVK